MTASIELFSTNYPKKQRTPISLLPVEEIKIPPTNTLYTQPVSETRRFITVLVITILAVFVFSSTFFTITDQFFSHIGIDLFLKNGQPRPLIMVIHSIVLFFLIYIILIIAKN